MVPSKRSLSELERAIILATQYLIRYYDVRPDAGMGPTSIQQLDRVIAQLGVKPPPERMRVLERHIHVWRSSERPGCV